MRAQTTTDASKTEGQTRVKQGSKAMVTAIDGLCRWELSVSCSFPLLLCLLLCCWCHCRIFEFLKIMSSLRWVSLGFIPKGISWGRRRFGLRFRKGELDIRPGLPMNHPEWFSIELKTNNTYIPGSLLALGYKEHRTQN